MGFENGPKSFGSSGPERNLGELTQKDLELLERADYYTRLGVDPNASQDEIKKAFNKLALNIHPDKNPGINQGKGMTLINEAYSILKDPEARSFYDQSLPGQFDAEEDKLVTKWQKEDAAWRAEEEKRQAAWKKKKENWEKEAQETPNFEDESDPLEKALAAMGMGTLDETLENSGFESLFGGSGPADGRDTKEAKNQEDEDGFLETWRKFWKKRGDR